MDAIHLNERDNVATALRALPAGAMAQVGGVSARPLRVVEPIPLLHKIALVDLGAGAPVIKYGEVIGAMVRDAVAGSVVHVHNMRSRRAQAGAAAPAATANDAAATVASRVASAAALPGLETAPPHHPGTSE